MNWAVVDNLEQGVILVTDFRVENANEAIDPAAEEMIATSWMEMEICDIVIVLSALPFHGILTSVPGF